MSKKKRYCVICGKQFKQGEWGNNPEPIEPSSSGQCCDECNMSQVLPARLAALPKHQEADRVYRPGAKAGSGDWVVRDKEPL